MANNNTPNNGATTQWFDDYEPSEDDFQIDEYDLTAAPNDFNVLTIYNFVETGAVKIPGFQRNYVWDQIRASKLIESLILGLPVPQIFLYEESKNSFLVIDGQQRLMSIYYFMKQRFPKKDKRPELRTIFDEYGGIPDNVLFNDEYFTNFNLTLPEKLPDHANKFKGLNYSTLGDHRLQFDLRPIRNVIVKQNSPGADDSAVYEIFNRLNTGGINLRPQEIRTSLYQSKFFEMLYRVNTIEAWRTILQMPAPDLHMKDIEILLRGYAMLIDGHNYAPSLAKFLNKFSNRSKGNSDAQNKYLEDLFHSFVKACEGLSSTAFINEKNGRFNIALYEAVFVAACEQSFKTQTTIHNKLNESRIKALEEDEKFLKAALEGTTGTTNVQTRLDRARTIIGEIK